MLFALVLVLCHRAPKAGRWKSTLTPLVKTIGSEQGYVAVTVTGVCCTRSDCAPEHDRFVVGVPLTAHVPFIVSVSAILPGVSVGAAF